MTRRLSSAAQALDDLAEIAAYVAEASGERVVAEAFVDAIRAQCAKLAALPGLLGRARPELRPDIRSFLFKGCVIFFRYGDGVLEIVDVLHGHRDVEANFAEDV